MINIGKKGAENIFKNYEIEEEKLIKNLERYFGKDRNEWRFMCVCCGDVLDHNTVIELLHKEQITLAVVNAMFIYYKVMNNQRGLD